MKLLLADSLKPQQDLHGCNSFTILKISAISLMARETAG
jgi:hypothetical protein